MAVIAVVAIGGAFVVGIVNPQPSQNPAAAQLSANPPPAQTPAANTPTALPATQNTDTADSQPQHNPNALNEFMARTEASGTKLIDSYHIADDVLYIELNEATWDGFDKSQKHRVCDMIAQTNLLDDMGVPMATLTLDNGRTTVGSISHAIFGPTCEFKDNAAYWNYQ